MKHRHQLAHTGFLARRGLGLFVLAGGWSATRAVRFGSESVGVGCRYVAFDLVDETGLELLALLVAL